MKVTNNNPFEGVRGITAKREILRVLSKEAKEVQDKYMVQLPTGEFYTPRVNEILLEMYKDDNNTEFKTFKGWLKAGKMVKKGSQAYVIWSKPRKVEKEVSENEKKEEYEMFGLCHMFSNSQVE